MRATNEHGSGTGSSLVAIIEQITICYSLCSATWPFTKTYLKGFDTSMLANVTLSGSKSGTAASNTVGSRSRSKASKSEGLRLRSDRATHSISVVSPDKIRRAGSFSSQELIIRREDTVMVTYNQETM